MTTPTTFIIQGDCLETLRGFPDASIDSVVSDPPYGLSKPPNMFEVLRHWMAAELREYVRGTLGDTLAASLFPQDSYTHAGKGFMGKTWDSFVPGPEVWREVLRVLKPGGHALVFSGTRTYDLTVLAMRIAGFEVRDQLAWMYGQGFPKSRNISIDLDKAAGALEHRGKRVKHMVGQEDAAKPEALPPYEPVTDEAIAWLGWGTGLKPGQEPIALARKPLAGTIAANVLEYGTAGVNIDGCRIETDDTRAEANNNGTNGWNTGSGVVAGSEAGRHPANVLLDEDAAELLDAQTGALKAGKAVRRNGVSGGATSISRPKPVGTPDLGYADSGGASRFFYVAKTSAKEREAGLEAFTTQTAGELTGGRVEGSAGLSSPRAGAGRTTKTGRANTHPTVKPIALMRYLVRLVTPPGGVVLDPYAGSGSTGAAAVLEGLRFVGCELEAEYVKIAEARIAYWTEVAREDAQAEAA